MPTGERDALERRYTELLSEICGLIENGRPPWWNQTAHQGPAILARSGQSLRGLPALIAWHVGERLPRRPLVWRLRPAAAVDVGTAAVFQLAANGGDALYAAVADRRPQEAQDSPTREHAAYWDLERLDGLLGQILARLGATAPELEADRAAIVSLAQAFLRPLGDGRSTTRVELGGRPWKPLRLARVAAWARLLADDVRMDVFRAQSPDSAAPRRWPRGLPRSATWPNPAIDAEIRPLCLAGWLQHCLPAEIRERVESIPDGDGRHHVPEQPLRPGLFRAAGRARAPALAGLTVELLHGPPPTSYRLPWVMNMMGWREKAALGLALAEALDRSPDMTGPSRLSRSAMVSEPGMAWRLIGRVARSALQHGERNEPLEAAIGAADAQGSWHALRKHHAVKSWFHPTSRAQMRDLVASQRWPADGLDRLLRQYGLSVLNEGGKEYRVKMIPIVRLATLRRAKRPASVDESAVRREVAEALGCADEWSAVARAAAEASWERHKRPKRDGSVRWLDVPCEPMRRALRVVSDLLFAVTPSQGTPTAFHPGASPALHACAHAGAVAAVRIDLVRFFESVRPWHIEPWLGLGPPQDRNLLPGWSRAGREALMSLLFRRRAGVPPYLPQGAPSSPAAANLAGAWLDHAVVHRAAEAFAPGAFTYTRYADDVVLSTRMIGSSAPSEPDSGSPAASAPDSDSIKAFLERGYSLLVQAVTEQRWRVQPSKTYQWTDRDPEPLHICGLRVPRDASSALSLGRDTWRRARAALHHLRLRLDCEAEPPRSPTVEHGLLAYAYAATADLRWLAYTSCLLKTFARQFAGLLFSESFLAGWSDAEPLAK